jgi:flagellar biogenesis protein FliO
MDFAQQIIVVPAVLCLLWLMLTALRRKGFVQFASRGLRSPRRMELIERLQLSPQHSIHLVRIDNRLVSIGVSPAGCQLLDDRKSSPAISREEER